MVPSSSSNCSTDTESGSSTSARARYSSSSRITPAGSPLPRGGVDALRLQELADLRGGLGALRQPLADAVLLEDDRRRLRLRVVLAHGLDEAPIPRRALVG